MWRSVRFAAAGRIAAAAVLLLTTAAVPARPQTPRGAPSAPSPAPAPAADVQAPGDPLGRSTPRSAVFGFLNAARKGDNAIARQYLNTRLRADDAEPLAHQLFIVLDARLPARLSQVSDAPEGSRTNPLALNKEIVGTIATSSGPLAVTLDRVTVPKIGQVWLFSRETLDGIPAAYEEVTAGSTRLFLPRYLTDWRIGGIRPFDWLVLLGGVLLLYAATSALNRGLTALVASLARRSGRQPGPWKAGVLPLPARLLLITLLSRWLLAALPLSLLLRQLFSSVATIVTICIVVWLGIVLNGQVERRVCRRIPPESVAGTVSLVRVGRRLGDVVVAFLGLVAMLRHLGVDPTPVVAGLGVGGLAVALAAQKTLENVIAGASLIFDQAVKIGDYLKVGALEGTVDHIGLRSTRIRTLDRTMVTVPNSQIASMSLETLSARDKFWFHPIVSLRYETRAGQMQLVIDGLTRLLRDHPSVDRSSLRVRFLRMAAFSLDIEVFAYVYARDWPHFLEIQERLLFQVMETVSAAGAALAYPSQTLYLAGAAQNFPQAPDADSRVEPAVLPGHG